MSLSPTPENAAFNAGVAAWIAGCSTHVAAYRAHQAEIRRTAELQLDDDRWAEAHKRASAFTSVTADDYPVISRGIYEQLCKEDWHP